ncbi:hypothetical protein [Ktedonospora formicarum]|uniref:Peptide zinc metalloprotease protein n=1 Tax=Ktedonospora formicarum TaxID=2778364 RepID=A0A8J3IES1_9CHLR|nr:hypothetical protein [Ktedonospora formicarum]GHO49899.1 hypothetical protein KSX_80620 [Ktedonospora formicarum]
MRDFNNDNGKLADTSSPNGEEKLWQHPQIQKGLAYVQISPQLYVVKNETTGRYFRLSASVVRIMLALDGIKSVEDISLELAINSTKTQYVVDQLARLRLLASHSSSLQHVKSEHVRAYGWVASMQRFLLIRKDIITSDAWMDRIYQRFGFHYLFQPWCAIFLLILYACALFISLQNFALLQTTLNEVTTLNAHFWVYLVLGWILFCFVGTLHELAHGFACKHFGGRVQGIGVALFYFRPGWYCDVTDAWMFSRRHQRLVTHAAGIAMDFFLTSCALLFLPFTSHIHWFVIGITLMLLVGFIRTLANFNPLLKLDGYYLLSDLLGIENLRRKSFFLLFSSIRQISYTLRITKRPPGRQTFRHTRWEKFFLGCYGFVSLAYSSSLIASISWHYTIILSSSIGLWSYSLFCLAMALFVFFPLWLWWYDSAYNYGTRK